MLRKLMIGAVAGVALALAPSAFAQGVGTAAEAKAMIEKAVTELKANEAAALAKFNKYELCERQWLNSCSRILSENNRASSSVIGFARH